MTGRLDEGGAALLPRTGRSGRVGWSTRLIGVQGPWPQAGRMSSSTARRAMPLVAAALLLIGSLGTAGTASATLTYDPAMPMILHNVTPEDLWANKNGVCTGHFTHVIRNVLGVSNATNYLNAAQHCGLKAILYFSSTVSGGTIYPSRVAPLVNAVKNHPALFGYLTV